MDQKEIEEKLGWAFQSNALEDERLPFWVRNIIRNISKSYLPNISKMEEADPDGIELKGLAIGSGIQIKEILEEKLPQLADIMGIDYPESYQSELEEEFNLVDELEEKAQQELNVSKSSKKREFHQAVTDGLEPILDERGYPLLAKTNTSLEFLMLILWPQIDEKCQNRPQLYEFLKPICPKCKVELGNYRRVEKICERIGFCPAKSGRPKKT
jgi:hypothetical protein